MSKIDVDISNIKSKSIPQLENNIICLNNIKNNLDSIELINGFSHTTYIKESVNKINKIINDINVIKKEIQDITKIITNTDTNLYYNALGIENKK